MSRGGRGGGGWRGGRGGRGAFGKQMIGGQEVSWDFDPDLVIENKPQETFPDIDLPEARPATLSERAAVDKYRAMRRRIHDGPFYTVLGNTVRVGKNAVKRAADFNPFEDMPTYTHRYRPVTKKMANFSTRKYQLSFFPEELWSTIDPKRYSDTSSLPRPMKSVGPRPAILDEDEDEKEKADEDEEAPKADDDSDADEEQQDDTFSDDDDEMGEDYDAEKYFDGGEDDAGEALGDGDGGDDGADY